MTSLVENRFNIDNYPKSYASIKIGDFRLKNCLHPEDNPHSVFQELKKFCYTRAARCDLITKFNGYPYINSGWEWSVFRNGEHTVLKIPSGIFPEVNDSQYLENTSIAYQCISSYYPSEFIPRTIFKSVNHFNTIEQEFIPGKEKIVVNARIQDASLMDCLHELLVDTLKIIKDVEWIPDINLQKTADGYCLENVRFDKNSGLLKIIDFTHYFDRSRMYPEKTKNFLDIQKQTINGFFVWMRANNQHKGQFRPQDLHILSD